ncbi:hypothetical protein [Pseudonocardia xishanensis]|uniref:Integral membrane protein n=1 Tax=Pseudonocardia xishanensis TaxID=630995 RepID=A0ABP8RVX3_9PSEU
MTEPHRPRATLWLLRILLTVHVLAVLGQPVLAGLFLSGDVDAIAVHGAVGSALAAVGLLLVGAALLHVLGGRGRLWILPVTVALFLAEGLQIGFGFAGLLNLHIPLGVLIVTGSILLAAWAWTPWAARPRGRRTPAAPNHPAPDHPAPDHPALEHPAAPTPTAPQTPAGPRPAASPDPAAPQAPEGRR